jgi:signal transduction histidine kinase
LREKILVVDDNLLNRKVAEGQLSAAGYGVVLAESGEQAVLMFQEQSPDLVLLDVMMPGIGGFEACQQIRMLPGGADTPIVFLTAMSDLNAHHALSSGADDFLTKPINRVELLLRVRSLLRIKQISTSLRKNHELIQAQHTALLAAQTQKQELTELWVHDLKNPLTSILANIQYILDSKTLDETEKEAMRDSATSVRAMHRIVLNLLDISRSENAALVPNRTQINVGALVKQVHSLMQHRAEQGDHELVVSSTMNGATIRADGELLRRLVENLLDNSLKYSPHGSRVTSELSLSDGFVKLRIKDEGNGVPVEHRSAIFEKYVRLAPGQARTSRGLGLAFCRLAVEAHGGRIWVEDNTPKGSIFCVDLPAT